MRMPNTACPPVGSGVELPPYIAAYVGQAPAGFRAGDANLRRYVANRPTTFVDPSGLEGVSSAPPPGSSGAGIADGDLGGSLSPLGDMGGIDALYSSRSDQSGIMTDLLYRPGIDPGPTMVPLGPFDPSTLPPGGLIVPAQNPAGPSPAKPGRDRAPRVEDLLPPTLRKGPLIDDVPFVPVDPGAVLKGGVTGKGVPRAEGLKAERDKWERQLGEALKNRGQPLIGPGRLRELNTEIDQLRGILQDIDRELELLRPGPAPGRLPQFPIGPGERVDPFRMLPREPERSFLPHSAVYPPATVLPTEEKPKLTLPPTTRPIDPNSKYIHEPEYRALGPAVETPEQRAEREEKDRAGLEALKFTAGALTGMAGWKVVARLLALSRSGRPVVNGKEVPELKPGTSDEMAREAGQIFRRETEGWSGKDKATYWEKLAKQIEARHAPAWTSTAMRGTNGEYIFSGGTVNVHGIVITKEGQVFVIGKGTTITYNFQTGLATVHYPPAPPTPPTPPMNQ